MTLVNKADASRLELLERVGAWARANNVRRVQLDGLELELGDPPGAASAAPQRPRMTDAERAAAARDRANRVMYASSSVRPPSTMGQQLHEHHVRHKAARQ